MFERLLERLAHALESRSIAYMVIGVRRCFWRGKEGQAWCVALIIRSVPTASDFRQALDRIGVLLHQVDEQRGLSVRPGAALLPVLQRAHVGAQINGKKSA